MNPWLRQLHDALRDEEAHGRAAHEQIMRLPRVEQVRAGLVWSPIRVEDSWDEGRKTGVLIRGTLHDGLDAGTLVSVGQDGPEGRVLVQEATWAELLLNGPVPDGVTSVHALFDASGWIRLRKALERAAEVSSPLLSALLEPPDDVEPLTHSWPGLNEAQAHAANHALAQRVGRIHGPPGTGKTHVLGAILAHAVAGGDRPYALADSNAATDHLALTAARRGLDVLRMGVFDRMHADVRHLALASWLERSPQAQALRTLQDEIQKARSRRAGGRELGPLFGERRSLQDAARAWVYGQFEVLATTHGTLGRLLDDRQPPPRPKLTVVDEASQAMEPSIWVVAPHTDRLILAGDPHQLGPVVLSGGSLLETSLLERVLGDAPMLEVQHRMTARIHALVQQTYGPRYRPHPSVAEQSLHDLPTLRFVDTAGSGVEERRDPVSQSLWNPEEVRWVGLALDQLYKAGVRAEQITILTPYSAQVARIQALGNATDVRVGSVNAMQGQEADVVLLAFVRSNPDGELGFVTDVRRLTVGLTRARMVLWMCGDSSTLARHARFNELLEDLELLDALETIWDPVWQEP